MKLYFKFDTLVACRVVLREQLEKLGIPYHYSSLGELELQRQITPAELKSIKEVLQDYGIEILEDPRNILVQKIKDLITEMINAPEPTTSAKFSDYMARNLNHSYGHISKIFSEITYTSIENYIILQKIEKTKQLITAGELTLTEIGWRLNYSSVQHLSNQFKKTTGITPSAFERIIKERRKLHLTEDSTLPNR